MNRIHDAQETEIRLLQSSIELRYRRADVIDLFLRDGQSEMPAL